MHYKKDKKSDFCNQSILNDNDAFRDMFIIKGYHEVKDQTRHGISINRKEALKDRQSYHY